MVKDNYVAQSQTTSNNVTTRLL